MYFQKFEIQFKDILQKQINKLNESPDWEYYISPDDIVNFVNMARETISIFEQNDDIITSLLQLLESADDLLPTINGGLADGGEFAKRTKRSISIRKRQTSNGPSNRDYFETTLGLFESFLKSKNETTVKMEKFKLTEKVHKFAQQLCKNRMLVAESFGKIENAI